MIYNPESELDEPLPVPPRFRYRNHEFETTAGQAWEGVVQRFYIGVQIYKNGEKMFGEYRFLNPDAFNLEEAEQAAGRFAREWIDENG